MLLCARVSEPTVWSQSSATPQADPAAGRMKSVLWIPEPALAPPPPPGSGLPGLHQGGNLPRSGSPSQFSNPGVTLLPWPHIPLPAKESDKTTRNLPMQLAQRAPQ
jgi:hypothetical protein